MQHQEPIDLFLENSMKACDTIADRINNTETLAVDAFEFLSKLGVANSPRCGVCGKFTQVGNRIFCSVCGPAVLYCSKKCYSGEHIWHQNK